MAKYGSSYLCILADCTNRNIFEILPSRSKNTLSKYLEFIPVSERNKVLYVTMDMWLPYKDIIRKYFKNAIIAVDPFHVTKHLNDCFTKMRLNMLRQLEKDSTSYYLLKKWHHLLDADCNLDNEPSYNSKFHRKINKRDIYEMLLGINEDYTLAFQLKESYRRFNSQATALNASEWLDSIIQSFTIANLPEYTEFVTMVLNWKQEILNSFVRPYDTYRLSNAFTENVNGKIRSYLGISNGTSNFERFRRKIIYSFND